MHKQLKGLLYAAAFILVFTSCEDYLNKTPGNKVTNEQHFNSIEDVRSSVNGAFVQLQDIMPNLIIVDGLLSDMMTVTDKSKLDILNINNHTLDAENQFIDPSGFYKLVVSINEILHNLESVRKKDQDFNELNYNLYLTDLIALRSWAYFTMVRLYGEAAYLPEDIAKLSEGVTLNYLNKQQMIDQLLVDMDTLHYDERPIEDFQMTMYMQALKGELYLEKKDYENAANWLITAIGGPYTLNYKVSATFKDAKWSTIFQSSDSKTEEVIVAIPFSLSDKQINPLYDFLNYDQDYQAKPSSVIIETFESQLLRGDKAGGDKNRGLGISYDVTEDDQMPFINKYNIDLLIGSSHIILYRASDLHLLLAEALNRLGKREIAMDIVNTGAAKYTLDLRGWRNNIGIRDRVGLNALPASENMETVEDIIINERAMELAFEGKRWFDLVRVAERRGPEYLANIVAAKFSDEAKANEIRQLLMDKNNWYLPFKK